MQARNRSIDATTIEKNKNLIFAYLGFVVYVQILIVKVTTIPSKKVIDKPKRWQIINSFKNLSPLKMPLFTDVLSDLVTDDR